MAEEGTTDKPQPEPTPTGYATPNPEGRRDRPTPEGDALDPTRYGDWERNGRCVDF